MSEDIRYEKLIDLHTHTINSDGSMTSTELVHHAKKNGLAAIAVTDHDTVSGVKEAIDEGEKVGLEIITGIELSAKSSTETHILGYDIDINNKNLKATLDEVLISRQERTAETNKKLNDLGFNMPAEEVYALAPNGLVGRAHHARLMMEKGYVGSVKEAFDKYLSVGKPAYCEKQTLTDKQAIEVIKNSGGYAFLAHLHLTKKDDDELFDFLKKLKDYGLDGIEGFYTDYTQEMENKYQSMARRLNLKISGGTDFHAKMKPHISIGTGLGNLKIPYSVLENIRQINV